MSSTTLPLKRYPVSKASELINDSEVAGATTADALDNLQDAISEAVGGGTDFVSGPTPAASTANAVALWMDAAGRDIINSTIIAHPVTDLSSVHRHKLELGPWFETRAIATAVSNVFTFDLDKANVWQATLTADGRHLALDRDSDCQLVTLLILQDGTGGRTVVWDDDILWDQDLPPVLDPTPNGWDLIVLRPFETDTYGNTVWREVSRSTGAPRKQIWTATDGATITFDLRYSRKQKVTLGGNRTLVFSGIQDGLPFYVRLKQDGTGSRTVTWPSGIKWAGNTAPTLSTGANLSDWFCFICTDPTTPTFDGFILGQGHPN